MADALESDIRSGRMRPGTRLAPQREFARTRGIASSTAARVYQELERRGLVTGEIGRGTFVRGAPRPEATTAASGPSALIDLEANFPVLPEQPAMLAAALAGLLESPRLAAALLPVGVAATRADRQTLATFLARGDWTPDPAGLLFTGSGRQSIAAAISGLVPRGGNLGVEELTYPVVKAIAANLDVRLVPVPMDGGGLDPTALSAVHAATPLHAVYLQPALHNPLGMTMTAARRVELAAVLRALDLTAIEDGVNCFLRDDAPLAAVAAEQTVYVDSFSKRIAAGLNLGIVVAPRRLRDRLAAVIRSATWTAPGFAIAATTTLIADGTVARIVALKRADAAARQAVVLERLDGFAITADPAAYHSWWELPDQWQAETFVSAAARHGIVINPAAAFAVGPAPARAVRISNSTPDLPTLVDALDTLAGLARRTPEDAGLEY